MKTAYPFLALVSCAWLVAGTSVTACSKDKVVDLGEGGSVASSGGTTDFGGAGGAPSTTTTTSGTTMTTTTTTTATTTTTSTGPSGCDTGVMASLDSPICSACVDCSLMGPCSAEYNACLSSQDCVDFVACAQNCGDQNCIDNCSVTFSAGATLYNDLLVCAVCVACVNNCDAVGSGCP